MSLEREKRLYIHTEGDEDEAFLLLAWWDANAIHRDDLFIFAALISLNLTTFSPFFLSFFLPLYMVEEDAAAAGGGEIRAVNFDPHCRPKRQDWDGDLVENGAFYFSTAQLLRRGLIQGGK